MVCVAVAQNQIDVKYVAFVYGEQTVVALAEFNDDTAWPRETACVCIAKLF